MPRRVVALSMFFALVLTAVAGIILSSKAQNDEPNTTTCIHDASIQENGTIETVVGTPVATDLRAAGSLDLRPGDPKHALVMPPNEDRELYLAVISLPPGECVPFEATGNRRDGAVIWMVQQGVIAYAWRPVGTLTPDATPIIQVGSNIPPVGSIPELTQRRLYPGDWVTQDRQVEVTYTNIGGEDAIILKAVYAKLVLGGCHGGCK